MNRVWISLASAGVLLFAVQPIAAETDVESELAEMRELVEGLQKQVEAQDEQISHQGELLEQAQGMAREAQSDSLSSLADFVDSIDVDGHLAGSWNWNFNQPSKGGSVNGGGGLNTGATGVTLPFHNDHNTFTVDQIWFGLGKPATEESRAGFRFDILYGNNANALGQGTGAFSGPIATSVDINGDGIVDFPNALVTVSGTGAATSRRARANDSTSDYYIAQAYVEYLAPVADVNVKFGKFQTMVGAEVVQATGNFNITRGAVYTLMQPVDHTGLLTTVPVGPMEVMAGVVSSGASGVSSPDNNDEVAYIGSVAYGNDRMSIRTTFIYGAEGGYGTTNNDDLGLVDVTAWFNPTDNISLWANYDYLYLEGTGLYMNGIALAGRVGITDELGVALRGEYVSERVANTITGAGLVNDFTGIGAGAPSRGNEVWTLTGTVDYALTDHLTVKLEGRYDQVREGGPTYKEFRSSSTGGSKDQAVALVEAVYEF